MISLSAMRDSFTNTWRISVPQRPRTFDEMFNMILRNMGRFIALYIVLGLAWGAFVIWAMYSVVMALVTMAAAYAGGV